MKLKLMRSHSRLVTNFKLNTVGCFKMRYYPLLFYVYMSLGAYTFYGQEIRDEKKVYWIENSGFFIENQENDILIDAILNSSDDIALARGKFSNVKLIFVSHKHGDHFNAEGVLNHLKNNPKAHLIAPPETLKIIERIGLEEELRSRIIPSLPKTGKTENITIKEYELHILGFEHAGVENIGFALKGNNLTMLYINGKINNQELMDDMAAMYNSPQILIANKWPLANKGFIDYINKQFGPDWLLMAHHIGKEDSIIKNNGGIKQMEENMSAGSMKGKIFEKKMQSISF